MSLLRKATANTDITVLSSVFVVATILLIILSSLVAYNVTLPFDSSVLTWINTHANPAFDSFFSSITRLGGVIVITAVTVALFVYLLFKKAFSKATLVAVGVGGSAALGFILKGAFERARPDLWEWIVNETYFSFPSGHATGSMALALCIIVLLWRTKWRLTAIIAGAIYVLVIGFSRLYLGVHYPTDILGGWLLSTAWVALVIIAIYMYVIKNRARTQAAS